MRSSGRRQAISMRAILFPAEWEGLKKSADNQTLEYIARWKSRAAFIDDTNAAERCLIVRRRNRSRRENRVSQSTLQRLLSTSSISRSKLLQWPPGRGASMRRGGFIGILGGIARGFWPRRHALVAAMTAMVLLPVEASEAGWLSDVFKGTSKQAKPSKQTK